MLRIAAVAAGAVLLAGARDDPLAGRTPGAPVECISLPQNVGPEVIDRHTILYRESPRRIWRTGPIGPCNALAPFQPLIVTIYGAQLCRNDRFQVLTPGLSIPSAPCRFDRFVPYDRPAR